MFAALYDRVMARSERAGLTAWRRELLADARGDVLEIGAGTGLNLAHYPPDTTLSLAEPDPDMSLRLTRRVVAQGTAAQVLPWPAEHLPVVAAKYDCVVSTLVLCSVQDPARAIAEVARVLRPGGRLLLIEHIAGTTKLVAATQHVLAPLWRCCAGGCRLRRDPRALLAAAGFTSDTSRGLVHDHLPGAPGFLRPALRGSLVKV